LLLQQTFPVQMSDVHAELEEQVVPSEVLVKHFPELKKSLDLHCVQSPMLSQSVHPVLFPLLLQQFPPVQTPDVHVLEDEHDPPSDAFALHLPELR
jgi:hypothetical protein